MAFEEMDSTTLGLLSTGSLASYSDRSPDIQALLTVNCQVLRETRRQQIVLFGHVNSSCIAYSIPSWLSEI